MVKVMMSLVLVMATLPSRHRTFAHAEHCHTPPHIASTASGLSINTQRHATTNQFLRRMRRPQLGGHVDCDNDGDGEDGHDDDYDNGGCGDDGDDGETQSRTEWL